MTDLAANLVEAERLIADTLAAARAELTQLDRRRADLVALIARTEAMQDALRPERSSARPMTLHEAIAFVLEESANRWMTTKELVTAINKHGLYRKRDGTPVEINQIHARINNYHHLFEKDGPRVRLHEHRSESMTTDQGGSDGASTERRKPVAFGESGD